MLDNRHRLTGLRAADTIADKVLSMIKPEMPVYIRRSRA